MATMKRRESAKDGNEEPSKDLSKDNKLEKPKVIDYSKKIPIIRTQDPNSSDENVIQKIAVKVSLFLILNHIVLSILTL